MSVELDIFNPQESRVVKGLEGKSLLIYGGNNLGKTYQASRFSKPYFLCCESGLGALSGVKYATITNWSDMKKVIKQLTSKKTVEKARALYDTIVIDEIYASSLFCQNYVIATYGQGAISMGDSEGKVNLYQAYEKEYFLMVNQILSCGYTVVFIGHEQEKNGYHFPKGDKRCIDPIKDNCDFVVYLKSNGIDEKGKVNLSSAYLAETDEFFARSRFTECVTEVTPYTVENLEKAIADAIEAEEKKSGIQTISFEKHKEMNTVKVPSFEELIEMLGTVGKRFGMNGHTEEMTDIIEGILGKGKKVSQCTPKQVEVMLVIYDELVEKADELGLPILEADPDPEEV